VPNLRRLGVTDSSAIPSTNSSRSSRQGPSDAEGTHETLPFSASRGPDDRRVRDLHPRRVLDLRLHPVVVRSTVARTPAGDQMSQSAWA
jgi:hypothetical protein